MAVVAEAGTGRMPAGHGGRAAPLALVGSGPLTVEGAMRPPPWTTGRCSGAKPSAYLAGVSRIGSTATSLRALHRRPLFAWAAAARRIAFRSRSAGTAFPRNPATALLAVGYKGGRPVTLVIPAQAGIQPALDPGSRFTCPG